MKEIVMEIESCAKCYFTELCGKYHFCRLMTGSPYTIDDNISNETVAEDCPLKTRNYRFVVGA